VQEVLHRGLRVPSAIGEVQATHESQNPLGRPRFCFWIDWDMGSVTGMNGVVHDHGLLVVTEHIGPGENLQPAGVTLTARSR
jgi:hypothetical protein